MVCVLYFLVTWPVSVNFDVDDIFSGHWGGENMSDGVSATCMLSAVDVCGVSL